MYTIPLDQSNKRERTLTVLKRVTNLSPMHKILNEVLELIRDINTTPQTLAKVISRDPSLVIKILSIANSPFYGLQKRVSTVDYAIMILGFNEIRNIVTALSLMESMKNKNDQYLDQKSFWLHSYLTGTTAKKIADDFGLGEGNLVFISGLLHDLGISVIHRYLHSDFVSILDKTKEGTTFLEAEQIILGMDHQAIGYSLLKQWNFPEHFSDIVRYHHMPTTAGSYKLAAYVVHLADYLTQALKIGDIEWDRDLTLNEDAAAFFNLSSQEEEQAFVENYREPMLNQAESLRYLL